MYIYEGSKILYDWAKIPQTSFSEKNFIAGALSKIVSGAIMYPFTTIRTRLQQNQYLEGSKSTKYQGVFDVIKRTWG